jgi:intein-encoded DNA endonuclease-like protein
MGKKIIFSEEQKQDIIKMYNQGYTQTEIGSKYNVCRDLIYRVIKEFGIPKSISKDKYSNIIELYQNGKTTVEIAKHYNTNITQICRILERNNIDRRHDGNRKYTVDETYFDIIDTPNKAYILGFFYADGCNYMKRGTISMSLQQGDYEILELIRKELKSDRPLVFVDNTKIRDSGLNRQDQYDLIIHSKYMSQSLNNIGMVPNKSLILEWPNLDDDMYRHFLRGYLDGDGHICSNHSHRVLMVSTRMFCIKAKEYIERELQISCKITKAPSNNDVTSNLLITHKNDCKKFLDYIYENADMYLDRKYQTYISKYCSENNISNTLTA